MLKSSEPGKIVTDLFQAYFDARKNKRSTLNALAFEKHFESKKTTMYIWMVLKN